MTHLRQIMLDELQRRDYSQSTVRAYIHAIEDFSKYFHRPPDRLGPDHIRRYQAHLFRDRKLLAATIGCRVAALRFFFVKTLRRPYLPDHIPFPKRPRQLPTVLSPEEVERLIDSAENLMRRTMVMTLYSTGVRCAELCHLKVSDIDSDRMVIHVRKGKGGRDRDVLLSSKLLETLREYWRWMKPRTYLFPGTVKNWRADVPITPKVVWKAVNEAGKRAGITKRVYPHVLRHSFDAIVRCRTAALGGHRDQCIRCGHNSCRNRHCPKCQGNARSKWLAAREAELLPVPYFHIVFTLPHELSALVLQNKRLLYDLLFRASAATMLELARDPKHLGADIGLLSVLHTWGQNLQHHPHVHCVVPAGGIAPDGDWVASSERFFLPIGAINRVFRGKFAAGLKQLFQQDKLHFLGSLQDLARPECFHRFLRQLFRNNWVVYAKPPFGGAKHVLHYLARYTHRVAVSNHRLVAFKDDRVSF